MSSHLTATASTIRLASASDGALEVNVTPSGQLDLSGSTVRSSTGRGYGFVVQGRLNATGCVIRECYMGVRIESDLVVVIRSTSIIDPIISAMVLDGANNATIEDVSITIASLAATASGSGSATDASPMCFVPVTAKGIVLVRRCSPRIDGIEVAITASVTVAARLESRTGAAGFRVRFDFPIVEVLDGSTLDASGIVVRDTRITYSGSLDLWNYVPGAVVKMDCSTALTAVYTHDLATTELSNCSMTNSMAIRAEGAGISKALHGSPLGSIEYALIDEPPVLLRSEVARSLPGPGPHRMRSVVRDSYIEFGMALVLELIPAYSGTAPPTFGIDVLLDNVSVYGGKGGIIVITFEPRFAMMKTLNATVRITRSTFIGSSGAVLDLRYLSGPDPADGSRWFALGDSILVEGCTFLVGQGVPDPTLTIRTPLDREPLNLYEREVHIRNTSFKDVSGPILSIQGRPPSAGGVQSVIVEGCTFENDHNPARTVWATLQNWARVGLLDCTFLNNSVDRGILIEDDGGVSGPGTPVNVTISGCHFTGNRVIFDGSPARGFVLASWGGLFEFHHNDISGGEMSWDEMVLLNVSERPSGALGSVLEVHNNTVHQYNGTVVLLSSVAESHTRLTATFRDNVAWDLMGALVDYPRHSMEVVTGDSDARIVLANNSFTNCSRTVLSCYGDVEVRGNRFEDCSGIVVRLEHLRLHGPVIEGNVFVRCADAYYIGSKYWVTNETSVTVRDDVVDCSGTAYWFYKMDALMENVTIATSAALAIVSEQSHVDVLESRLGVGSGDVVWTGYIHVWFDLECWVGWANASGVPSGLPVPHATVTYNDSAGVTAESEVAGADGHVAPLRLMQWSMDVTLETSLRKVESPYNVTATCATCEGSARVDLWRSLVGEDAVHILVIDRYLPALRITSPKDGNLTSQDPLRVEGSVSDRGSGILSVSIWWDDGQGQVGASLLDGGNFTGAIRVPEGAHNVWARAVDAAGNAVRRNVSVVVDLTPPALAVTSPHDGLVTRDPVVAIVGTYELGAKVWVAGRQLGGYTGSFDLTIRLVEGANVVVARAVDRAGNVAEVVLHLTLDTIPPDLVVFHPRDGDATNVSRLLVDGRAEGASGLTVEVVYVGGENVTTSIVPAGDWSFTETVPLREGWNVLVVHAFDLAGNVADVMLNVTLDSIPPFLLVVSPKDGTSTREPRVRVVAQVGADAVSVTVAGRQVPVRTEVDVLVDLVEGGNAIVVRAFDAVGNERAVTVNVVLDTVPPYIVITAPAADPFLTNSSTVRVSGRVEGGASAVTVGGRVVLLAQGAFEVDLMLSGDGIHVITVNATDAAGNEARRTFTVDLDRTPARLLLSYEPPGNSITGSKGILKLTGTTDATAVRAEVDVTSGGRTRRSVVQLDGRGAFTLELDLSVGGNTVSVRLLDRYGNWNSSTPHEVVFERTGDGWAVPSTGTSALLAVIVVIAVVSALVAWHQLRGRRLGRGRGRKGAR